MITVTVSMAVEIPSVPNFFNDHLEDGIDVADISDDDLRAIGALWTTELIQNAQKRRAARKPITEVSR